MTSISLLERAHPFLTGLLHRIFMMAYYAIFPNSYKLSR